MEDPRTPREAKQQFLDDLIDALRSTPVVRAPGESGEEVFKKCKQYNRQVITEVATRHGLTVE